MEKTFSSPSPLQIQIHKHPVALFILFTYAFSWICWIPILPYINADVFSSPTHVIFFLLLGGYSPSIAAIVVSMLASGRKGITQLLGKLKIMKVGLKWYIISLLTAPVLLLLATIVYTTNGGELGWTNYNVFLFLPVFFLIAAFFGPLGEELGWRGYLLPLVEKHGFFAASIFVGVIWTFWHAPLFWAAEGTSISGVPVTFYTVSKYLLFVTGTSLIYTWIYQNTRKSVFLAILIHMSSNGSHMAMSYLFPNIPDKRAIWNIEVWLLSVLLAICLLFFVKRWMNKKNFQDAN